MLKLADLEDLAAIDKVIISSDDLFFEQLVSTVIRLSYYQRKKLAGDYF